MAPRAATLAFVLGLQLACACSSDPRPVQLDFTERTTTPYQPRSRPSHLMMGVGAMIGPEETYVSHAAFLEYLADAVGREARMVQRRTYQEMNHLLLSGEVDVAFICTGAYVAIEDEVILLAAPVLRGEPSYRSVIVATHPAPRSLDALRGKHFAFTDPMSNTGRYYPVYLLRTEYGTSPDLFFGETTYSGAHDDSVRLVAAGLADAAAVDEHVLRRMRLSRPENTARVEVIRRSPPFGSPPFVARGDLPEPLVRRLRAALLESNRHRRGRKLLDAIGVDGFVESADYSFAREVAAVADLASRGGGADEATAAAAAGGPQ